MAKTAGICLPPGLTQLLVNEHAGFILRANPRRASALRAFQTILARHRLSISSLAFISTTKLITLLLKIPDLSSPFEFCPIGRNIYRCRRIGLHEPATQRVNNGQELLDRRAITPALMNGLVSCLAQQVEDCDCVRRKDALPLQYIDPRDSRHIVRFSKPVKLEDHCDHLLAQHAELGQRRVRVRILIPLSQGTKIRQRRELTLEKRKVALHHVVLPFRSLPNWNA